MRQIVKLAVVAVPVLFLFHTLTAQEKPRPCPNPGRRGLSQDLDGRQQTVNSLRDKYGNT